MAATSLSTTKPKSQHTASPLLTPFLGPTFDPTAYLNSHLAPLGIPTPAHPVLQSGSLPIAEHAARTQPQLAALAALANQLTATLTELTDEVLRSGARLAYAVELLRGEAQALRDSLHEGLSHELQGLIPGGLEKALERLAAADREDDDAIRAATGAEETPTGGAHHSAVNSPKTPTANDPALSEPTALAQLRTLHRVRARLSAVTETFDAALAWPLPPSAQQSGAGGLVSIVAPPSDPREAEESRRREEQGQAAQAAIQERIAAALAIKGSAGVRQAEQVLEELRRLCEVWKGTAEEKARVRFVDGLARTVTDRKAEAGSRPGSAHGEGASAERTKAGLGGTVSRERASSGGGGLFGGLRRLKDEIYLD